MFKQKNSFKRLYSLISTLRGAIENKEVLDYLIGNLGLATRKGSVIRFMDENKILVVDNYSGSSFYMEIKPNLYVIDEIYARKTKDAGNHDERFTATFDEDSVKIHSYSSTLKKNHEEHRIASIDDEFMDMEFLNGFLSYRKFYKTNVSYPSLEDASSSTILEEVVVKPDHRGAFKRINISSATGDEQSYGLFDASLVREDDIDIDELKGVQTITQEEYQEFKDAEEKSVIKDKK